MTPLENWHAPGATTDVQPRPQHAGVWLDRCYLGDDKGSKDGKEKRNRAGLYEIAAEILRPTGELVRGLYAPRFKRWRESLGTPGPLRAVRVLELETQGRLLLHPSSGSSPTDGSVLLHHTYGVPFLPGSGLKGLVRAWGRAQVPYETLNLLLGPERETEHDRAALVNFLDAMWVPSGPADSPDWSPLEVDVVTPHHSAYYTQEGIPGDWEEPVPTTRVVVSKGARFCVILEGCQAEPAEVDPWLDLAATLLRDAARELGFGAYTRAGYGRLGATASAQRPAATPVSERVTGALTLDPGSGRLTAILADKRKASVDGEASKKLWSALPPKLQEQIRKAKGNLRLELDVEPIGTALRITKIHLPQ